MPIHDYQCDNCNFSINDYYTPRLSSAPPTCTSCGEDRPMQRLWTTNSMPSTFPAFDFELDGGKVVTVNSLAQLRKIESDSEKAWKAGTGRPFIFRHASMDASNKDKGVFDHLQPRQIDPRKAGTRAGVPFDFGPMHAEPTTHPAVERARRKKSDRDY